MTPFVLRLVRAALALTLIVSSSHAQARHVYMGTERELALDASRIAVHDSRASAAEIAAQLSEFGITTADVIRWPIAGWWLVSVPAEAHTRARVEALVGEIERQARVDFVTPVFFGDDGGPLFPTRDILVGLDDVALTARFETDFAALGRVRDRRLGGMERAYRVESSARNGLRVLDAALALARDPHVRFAEPDMVFTGRGGHVPNDPGFANCWGIHNVGQLGGIPDQDMDGPEAWDRTIGSASVTVVVLDTGVQPDHPDIHQIAGIDTTSDGPGGGGAPVNAFDNHGTAVAGCISARIDNGIGTVGIAPGCVSASARTFIGTSSTGNWTSIASWTVASLNWAQTIGARVTNNSNVYGFQSSTIANKYLATWNAGQVHFACAGNGGSSTIGYPASIPIVNAVMAVERHGVRANFSDIGVGVDFAAPGLDIYSTDRTGVAGYSTGDYATLWGTSFATPYAAGVAALLCSALPSASAATIEQLMRDSCVDLGSVGYDTTFGHGFVNARAALVLTCAQPVNYCVASPNSVGPGAVMGHWGSVSVATNDLTLSASGCPPNASGLFYFGSTTLQAPFGNGVRCIGGTTFRLPIVVVNLFGDATHALDIASLSPAAGVVAGATKNFQLWYRNPAGGGAGFNLSDGLQVTFCP